MNTKLTVFFDNPFWVGVFERLDEDLLETSRVVFGGEPKDYEVYTFDLENYYNLKFSRPIKVEAIPEKRINPKRLQREIKEETSNFGIGTKAQQAIKKEQEARKQERSKASRENGRKLSNSNLKKDRIKRRKRKKDTDIS